VLLLLLKLQREDGKEFLGEIGLLKLNQINLLVFDLIPEIFWFNFQNISS
jgi:hypothetical protein